SSSAAVSGWRSATPQASRCRVENAPEINQDRAVNGFVATSAILLTASVLAGCKKPEEPASLMLSDPGGPTQAQPKLQTMKLWVGPEETIAELALTAEQQR